MNIIGECCCVRLCTAHVYGTEVFVQVIGMFILVGCTSTGLSSCTLPVCTSRVGAKCLGTEE